MIKHAPSAASILAGRVYLSVAAIMQAFWNRSALARQRARLGQLDDHMLRDIGLTRGQAETEAARPAWDAPDHWRTNRRNS
jgi:uncharacterized protein YjiS (DUF1127 family)